MAREVAHDRFSRGFPASSLDHRWPWGGVTIRTTFAALRHPNYRIWASADLVSITGTWMQVLAINWYVLQVTGSAANMGATVLLQTLPALLLGPLGGVLADRFSGRAPLILTQLTHALLAAALAVIAYAPEAHLHAVYVIAACGGIVGALEGPLLGRFNSTIVDRDTLSNAISLGSLINSGGRVMGMALGGVVVATAGTGPLFAANALSFLAVIAALCAIRPSRLHQLVDPASDQPRAGLRSGLAYLARQPVVLLTLALAVVLGSLGRNYQITMAAMSDGPLASGAEGYGVLSTAFAVGTVVGGFLAAGRSSLGLRTLIGLGLLTSAAEALAGLAPSALTMAAIIVPIAAGAVMIDTTVSTRIQLDTHGSMRGRVLGVAAAASGVAGAFGAPLLGWLCEHLGPRPTLVGAGLVVGAACLATGLALARYRGLRLDGRQLWLTVRETLAGPARQAAPA